MSHIASQKTKPGEPLFQDMQALEMACQMLGLEIVRTNKYTWFGRSVGDYPLPDGMKESDLGNNALFVIKLGAEQAKKHGMPGSKPYDIGMLADPNNPGCFVPMYDFWNSGYGLGAVVGEPATNKDGDVTMLCPKLVQMYHMMCDKLAAQAVGDDIEFYTLKEANEKYPDLFPQKTEDVNTWVSVADTRNRVS